MDERAKYRLKILNWDRNWFVQKIKDANQVQAALDALDAYDLCQKLKEITPNDIKPIASAARSLNRHVREMAVVMLIIFGLDWQCACDILLTLVSHSNGQIRWTAITHVPYYVAFQRESFPQAFILEFLRKAMKDKIPKNRLFAYEGVMKFFRPDLLPEIRSALATETKKEIIDMLNEVKPKLERGFYGVPYIGKARTDQDIRIFLEDGTLLEMSVPMSMPMSDVQDIADNIRKKPLPELKAAQAAFEKRLHVEKQARRELALEEVKKAEEARGKGLICPKCGFSYKWDGVRCGHCNHAE
jgi:hypothetical protein